MPGLESFLAPFPRNRLLNDVGIRTAMQRGLLQVSPETTDDQLQPGSLDVRIGKTYVFDNDARMRYASVMADRRRRPEESYEDFLDSLEMGKEYATNYPDEKDIPIVIPPDAQAEIHLHETISSSLEDFFLTYELRSSRGRLGLRPWGTTLERDEEGLFFSVTNTNRNPLILYGQDKVANLFFHLQRRMRIGQGVAVTDPRQVAKLLPDLADHLTSEGYILFRAGKTMKTFREGKTIDTRQKMDESFYHAYDLSGAGAVLPLTTPAIVQLTPDVELSERLGILFQHRIPFSAYAQGLGLFVADLHHVNAGWIDQGYRGSLTAHPAYFMMPRLVKEGMPLAFGILYSYGTASSRSYGDPTLGSHYQGSSGATTSRS